MLCVLLCAFVVEKNQHFFVKQKERNDYHKILYTFVV